jgi:uncharacterized protein
VELERLTHADDFLAAAGDFLTAREAEHNVILGLSSRLRESPHAYGDEDPFFLIAKQRGRVVAAALRTPPHSLLLSETRDERATEAICAAAHEAFPALPGVVGPAAVSQRFARAWSARTGTAARLAIAQRLYRAEAVTPPAPVPGRMRQYAAADEELAVRWLEAFAAEALPGEPAEDASEFLERRLADPDAGLVLWEDERPVSLAGYAGPTPSGIRVAPVYTPPELRRRGYASALTARLTQVLLDGGRRFCFLFTDLANPTSNSIYQRIGYEPVTDVDFWRFE